MTGPFRTGPTGGVFQVGARVPSPLFPFPTEIRLQPATAEYVRAVTGAPPLPPANAVYVHVDGTVMRLTGSGDEGRPRGPFRIFDGGGTRPAPPAAHARFTQWFCALHPGSIQSAIGQALGITQPFAQPTNPAAISHMIRVVETYARLAPRDLVTVAPFVAAYDPFNTTACAAILAAPEGTQWATPLLHAVGIAPAPTDPSQRVHITMHAILLRLLTIEEMELLAPLTQTWALFERSLERLLQFKNNVLRRVVEEKLHHGLLTRALHIGCTDRVHIGWEADRLRQQLQMPGPDNPTAIDIRRPGAGRATDYSLYRNILGALAAAYLDQAGDSGNTVEIQQALDPDYAHRAHATYIAVLNAQRQWPHDSTERTAALRTAFQKMAGAIAFHTRVRQMVEYACHARSRSAAPYLRLVASVEELLGTAIEDAVLWDAAVQLPYDRTEIAAALSRLPDISPRMRLLVEWFGTLSADFDANIAPQYMQRALELASHSPDMTILEEGYRLAMDSGLLIDGEAELLSLFYDALHIRNPARLINVPAAIEAIQTTFAILAARLSQSEDPMRFILDPAVRVPAIRAFLGAWARERAVADPSAEVASIERALEAVPPYVHLWTYQQLGGNPLWVKVLLVRAGLVATRSPLAADRGVVEALRDRIAPDTVLDHALDQLRTARQRYLPTAAPTALPPGLRVGWEGRLRTVPRVVFAMLTSPRLSEAMTLFLAHHFGVHTGFPAAANDPVTTP